MTSRVFSFPSSVVTVFVMLLVSLLLLAASTSARTISVGVGKEHASIQAAIDAADAGDTVLVDDGVYDEGPIECDRPLLDFFFSFFLFFCTRFPSVRIESNWNWN